MTRGRRRLPRPRGLSLRGPGPARHAGHRRLALCLLLLLATSALAVVMNVTYTTELNMNNGHDVPAGQRNLPGGTINVTCDNPPSNVTLFNQLGILAAGEIGQVGAACGADTATPDPATTTRLLFEGRTQVITQVVDGDGIPALGPIAFAAGTDAGDPIFFDADTGPPDHAILDPTDTDAFTSTNPQIVRDLANFRVTFNQAAVMAGPLDLGIQGRVLNIPMAGAPLGEVGATVSLTITRQNGGSIAPLMSPITTFTGPFLIQYTVDPMPDPTNPMFDGVANEEGAFFIPLDFTMVQDGVYDLVFFVRDVQGNVEPNDGMNLVVQVVIDRSGPTLEIRQPVDPLIVNQPGLGPFCEDPMYTLSGQLSDGLSQPGQVVLQTFHNDALVINPIFTIVTQTTTTPFQGFFSADYDLTTAPVIPGPGDQDLFVTTADGTDAAGNASNQDFLSTIWDQVPTEDPAFLDPIDGFTTSTAQITFRGEVTNIRPGVEELEEHGTLDFLLTLVQVADPTQRTTFVIAADPSPGTHSSGLDVIVAPVFPFATADDILGDVPDEFSFTRVIDFSGLPDGNYLAELQTFDQACNRSNTVTQTLCVGRIGPTVLIDLGMSGPDDNYDTPDFLPNRPPNQFGADDPVFVISLRSPERPDPGNPPMAIPVPFPAPPADFDPGSGDALLLVGAVMDPCTTVVEVRASGPNIATTVFTVTPPMGMSTFSLGGIDVTNLAEGVPELLNIVATNSSGQMGPTTNVIILRDVVPGRAPRITAPTQQPFFTNLPTLDLDGIAEPSALVALLLPPTTGTPVAPIPRTTNGDLVSPPMIPNPRSLFNSIPVFALTTRARPDGSFSFRGASLQNVDSGLVNPVTLLVQTIDTFDNTDPVLSVTPFDVFRTTGLGNLFQVVLDPGTLREQLIFPALPTPPTTFGEFRGIELVDIQVTYDTFVVVPPEVVVTQVGAPPVRASLVDPADPSGISTAQLLFRYPVRNVVATHDGPVLVTIQGGRDVFGTDLGTTMIADAFTVDSVAPVLATTTSTPTFPALAQRINNVLPLLQANLEDVPAMGVTTASGVSFLASQIQLFGPLEMNPDAVVPLVPGVPTAGFNLAFQPAVPLTQDGTYRMVIVAVDNVGNRRLIVRTFSLDRSPVAAPSIDNDPDCGSFVNVLPQVGGVQAITARIMDPTIDLVATSIAVVNSNGDTIPTTKGITLPDTIAVFPTPPIPLDGSGDGRYDVLVDLIDVAGNPSPQVTCTFTFDTTPPSIAIPDPADGACVRDPLRRVQVALADPPSLLSTSIFSAGIDLDRTRMEVRLVTPSFPNPTFPGTLVPARQTFRTTSGGTIEAVLLEFLDSQDRVRSLAADGSEDGVYRIETLAVDRAGNARTHLSTFSYDTQEPTVTLLDFPDPASFGGAVFRIRGEAFDLGPCGFARPPTPLTTLASTTVQYRVIGRDPLGRPVLPPMAPFYDFRPADSVMDITTGVFQGISERASFETTGVIPMVPAGTEALIQVKITDGAGNARIVDRRLTVSGAALAAPVPIRPPASAFVNLKVLEFRWEPLLFANRYELELMRVTPTNVTTGTTLTLPFPTDSVSVDLDLLAAQVPMGSPITTASAFTWRIRGIDAGGNPGAFSASRAFTLDPNAPRALDVEIDGVSIGAGAVVTSGPSMVRLVFTDESGMDPAVPPQAFLTLRDPRVPEVQVPFTFSGNLTADATLAIQQLFPDRDPNGTATLVVRGARDLAGNPMPPTSFQLTVDIGPYVDLRLAPNPVDPLDLLFAFVTRDFQGGPAESIPFSAVAPHNPGVAARQQGRTLFEPLSVQVVASTTPPMSAFHGSYRVDPNLHGVVDFQVAVADAQGHQGVRSFSVNAAVQALLKEGIVFHAAGGFGGVRFGLKSLAQGARVYGMSSAIAAVARPESDELVEVLDLGSFLPDPGELEEPATVVAPLDPGRLEVPVAKLAIYRATPEGWRYLGARKVEGGLEARTTRLGRFAVLADVLAPRAEESPDPSAIHLTDGGSGVDPQSVVFHGLAAGPVPGVFDAMTGLAIPDPAVALRPGRRRVEVEARDRSGNTAMTRLGMTIAGPPGILEAVAVPNPVRVGPALIRYRLDAPGAAARLEIYDTVGRRVRLLDGPAAAGVNTVAWDLRSARGGGVANGVYLFRLSVNGGGATTRATGKLAVLR